MIKFPLVSICIPTFNGERYLRETLKSVEKQTYNNFEVVLSDDCSKDQTLNIISNFIENVNFPVCVYNHQPSGIGANWNNCLKHAKGRYIKFLFQDDVMENDCLEKMVSILEANAKVGLVASKRGFIIEEDMKTEEVDKWIEIYGDLQNHLNLPPVEINILDTSLFGLQSFYGSPLNKIGEPSVVMFRKSVLDEVGYFNEDLKQILDYEYWYRILKKYPIAIINKPLVKFRLHQNQATNLNINEDIDDYNIYEQILYKQYLKLLHPKVRKRLYLMYHPIPKFKKSIKKLLS